MIALFFGALITFSITLNQDNQDLTQAMSEASLPIIYFYQNDTPTNELHGYVQKMDMSAMRDSITPIGKDRQLKLQVQTYGYPVDGIRYEIRSMDGERLVAKNDVTDYRDENHVLNAELTIQDVLEEEGAGDVVMEPEGGHQSEPEEGIVEQAETEDISEQQT